MLRRLVTVPSHKILAKAWIDRASPSAVNLVDNFINEQKLEPPGEGIKYDRTYIAVPLPDAGYVLSAIFPDQPTVDRYRQAFAGKITGIFVDPEVRPLAGGFYCGGPEIGAIADVRKSLGLDALTSARLTGRGVSIAVVDTCVDGTKVRNLVGGWAPPQVNYQPGSYQVMPESWTYSQWNHGTMCAMDAAIAAPDANFLDYAMLFQTGGLRVAYLHDAFLAFAELVDLTTMPGAAPLVVLNAWGLYDRSEDSPVGTPDNYSANPQHPLNVKAAELSQFADVFFAAGNCGEQCADPRCGTRDIGPRRSIHGANSHPDVTTVAAVTTDGRRLGYSSQGPGQRALDPDKPDVAASSHFRGSEVFRVDTGTSAACALAVGICAALRQRAPHNVLSSAEMKLLLQRTANDINGGGFDHDLGHGVIDAAKALSEI